MTREQEAAMRQLAAALGVQERRPVTKDMAGRVLGEVLDSMAGHVRFKGDGKPDVEIQQGAGNTFGVATAIAAPSTPPKGSELEKLASYLVGSDLTDQVSTGNVNANPLAEIQASIARLERRLDDALAAHATNNTTDDDNTDEE